ncbi:AAA family ATPase [Rugamonas rubra]|uniref:General secretion pathway protein A n=1 Tax=Rugamonas rubra TaxID=758825 RepID=A0A1I4KS03_9BURK|nr:ExeA family protein [Rugamonas rubra]SFL81535.1 general secretion pathway protein A [Rugamonas rubra]
MYTQFFHLKQAPFSIAPDPRYLFMSERHREALAHLLYGVGGGGGFVLLTGEIGAGKTTVCRCFMEQIPDNCKLGYIFNPKLSVEELLLSVCDEFRIELAPHGAGAVSVKTYVDAINRYLLASHAQACNNVLIIDEAQNLSADVLEQLRLLTNLETSERKLLQIILIGQPELRTMLARPELEQLAQRIIARYHLGSLSIAETGSYVEHRLAVAGAGATSAAPLPRRLMPLLHQLSKGVPRRINLLCDRALLGAYVENQPQVTRAILRKAAAEVFAGERAVKALRRYWPYVAGGVLAGALISGAAAWHLLPASPAAPAAPAATDGRAAAAKPAAAVGAGAGAAATAGAAGSVAGSANGAAGGIVGSAGLRNGAAGTGAVGGTGLANGAAGGAASTATPGVGAGVAAATAGAAAADSEAVMRQLAALWGLTLPDGEPCQLAAKMNLRCLQGKATLAELRRLDRPALLVLNDNPAAPQYALLIGLGDKAATLSVAGRQQNIALAALEQRYAGEYATFWRAPRGWREQVGGGDHGADVDWLARRLAQLYGVKKPLEGQPLDAALQLRLREFQQAQQLKADGVAGPKTFIRLNQLGGVAEPRLLVSASAADVVAGK